MQYPIICHKYPGIASHSDLLFTLFWRLNMVKPRWTIPLFSHQAPLMAAGCPNQAHGRQAPVPCSCEPWAGPIQKNGKRTWKNGNIWKYQMKIRWKIRCKPLKKWKSDGEKPWKSRKERSFETWKWEKKIEWDMKHLRTSAYHDSLKSSTSPCLAWIFL